MFKEILGQTAAKEYLEKALAENRLPNTLLFVGPEGVGKKKTALALASHLLAKTQSDLHILSPEGKVGLHSIEAIRAAIDLSHEAPFEAPVKFFIIDLAERMQPAAANALLKTLEEPVLDSYWILVTSKPKEILPTILSRCVKVTFQPLTTNQVASLEFQVNPGLIEARKILLTLLSSQPSYIQIFSYLEQIEDLIENEDPLIYQNTVSSLFATIALHYREKALTSELDWIEALDETHLAFDRNIKLSTCLETFLLKKNYP